MCVKVPPAFRDRKWGGGGGGCCAGVAEKSGSHSFSAGYSARPPGVGNTNVAEGFFLSAPDIRPGAASEPVSPCAGRRGDLFPVGVRPSPTQSQRAVRAKRSSSPPQFLPCFVRIAVRVVSSAPSHVAPLGAPTLTDVQVLHTGGRWPAPPSNQRRSASDGGGTAAGHCQAAGRGVAATCATGSSAPSGTCARERTHLFIWWA